MAKRCDYARQKITGILTEMYLKGEEIDFVVIGTGVNVKAQTFPEELVNASDIETESGRVISRKELLEVIVDEFFVLYEEYIKTGNLRFVKETYEKALVNKDREVLILDPAGEYRAVAEGIDEKENCWCAWRTAPSVPCTPEKYQ